MKKRLFAIMLALAMLLVAVPALAEEVAVEQDNTAGNKICATERCGKKQRVKVISVQIARRRLKAARMVAAPETTLATAPKATPTIIP